MYDIIILQMAKKSLKKHVFSHTFLFHYPQLIQTISAVDTDEPLVGHKFVFSMSFSNPNFTIIDNEGS